MPAGHVAGYDRAALPDAETVWRPKSKFSRIGKVYRLKRHVPAEPEDPCNPHAQTSLQQSPRPRPELAGVLCLNCTGVCEREVLF